MDGVLVLGSGGVRMGVGQGLRRPLAGRGGSDAGLWPQGDTGGHGSEAAGEAGHSPGFPWGMRGSDVGCAHVCREGLRA